MILADGTLGRAAVPSGASTGVYEAVELRDGDKKRYLGKGVTKAVANVNDALAKVVVGRDAVRPGRARRRDDRRRRHRRTRGSSAPTRSSASASPPPRPPRSASGLPLYRYLGGVNAKVLPVPMANIINGGKHADNKIDFQEFMIMPLGAKSFSEGIRMVAEVFHNLKSRPQEGRAQHHRRRRGRLRPEPRQRGGDQVHPRRRRQGRLQRRPRQGLRHRPRLRQLRAVRRGREEGLQVLEVEPRQALLQPGHGRRCSPTGSSKYPIVSIEDPLDQDDWDGYAADHQGPRRQGARSSATTSSSPTPSGWPRGSPRAACNSILVKVNQIGTLTETLDAVEMAQRNGYTAVSQPPLGRDRGRDDRRHRRRHQLRPDQDRQRLAAPTGSPSTTSSSGSRKSWATRPSTGRRSGRGGDL